METTKAQKNQPGGGEPAGGDGQEEGMESLLAQQAQLQEKLSGRKVAWVKVISIVKDQVLVDIGDKRDGVVAVAEFGATPPAPGQRVPVVMLGSSRGDGPAALSHTRARQELAWDAAGKAFAEKSRVRGQVTSSVKGGFMVDVGGISGFLPASLADLHPVRNPARMLKTGVRCYIIELNAGKKQLVLSRKAVLEEESAKRKEKLLEELRVGEVRIGRVVSVGPAGVLVDIGGAEGFVKAADVAWGAPKAPFGIERGAKLRVKVLSKPVSPAAPAPAPAAGTPAPSANAESKGGRDGSPAGSTAAPSAPAPAPAPAAAERIGLGIKQLSQNPADLLKKKYPPRSVVHGTVAASGPDGVRVKLGDGRMAHCPLSETDPEAPVKEGQSVSAIVIGVDQTRLEPTVSLTKYSDIQDRKRMAQYMKAPPPLTLGQLLSPATDAPEAPTKE